MAQLPLKVDNLPQNRLGYTNCVYLNPGDAAALVRGYGRPIPDPNQFHVRFMGKWVFYARSLDLIPNGMIALNGLQRRSAKLTLGAQLMVSAFVPTPDVMASRIVVEVNLLVQKNDRTHIDIDCDRLSNALKVTFFHHVFTVGQELPMEFEGIKLRLAIMAIEAQPTSTSSSSSPATDGGNNPSSPTGSGGGGGGFFGLGGKSKSSFSSSSSKAPAAEQRLHGQLGEGTRFGYRKEPSSNLRLTGTSSASLADDARTNLFKVDFDFDKLGIGGLTSEFNKIFRRAFASRTFPPAIVQQMGIKHLRGMLLYGPPGCGKTLIARKIGEVLHAAEVRVINGPEVLDKYVGGSEEKIRELFAGAEKEQKEKGEQSGLHIIIFDEIDAICRSRGSSGGDSTGVRDSIVNQMLSKIDGVDSLDNVFIIGMTNRKDMIDEALLRPGRLELHVEIGLPDEGGRLQILRIHTRSLEKHKRVTAAAMETLPDLAVRTKNYSGAELEGVVKSATSYAFQRCVDVSDLSKEVKNEDLVVQLEDFENALDEVRPAFGANSDELEPLYRNGLIPYGPAYSDVCRTINELIEQVRTTATTPLLSCLLTGPRMVGKTALMAHLASGGGYPFVRLISAEKMIGMSDSGKCATIHRVFMDSYKSPLSIICLDDIEALIDYVPVGPRFSPTVLRTLAVLINKPPPVEGRRLLVVGTTSCADSMGVLGLATAFSFTVGVPQLSSGEELAHVIEVELGQNEGSPYCTNSADAYLDGSGAGQGQGQGQGGGEGGGGNQAAPAGSSASSASLLRERRTMAQALAGCIVGAIGIKRLLLVLGRFLAAEASARAATGAKGGGGSGLLLSVEKFEQCLESSGFEG